MIKVPEMCFILLIGFMAPGGWASEPAAVQTREAAPTEEWMKCLEKMERAVLYEIAVGEEGTPGFLELEGMRIEEQIRREAAAIELKLPDERLLTVPVVPDASAAGVSAASRMRLRAAILSDVLSILGDSDVQEVLDLEWMARREGSREEAERLRIGFVEPASQSGRFLAACAGRSRLRVVAFRAERVEPQPLPSALPSTAEPVRIGDEHERVAVECVFLATARSVAQEELAP